MATEIKIVWDGNVSGLAEHRLSIGAFGGPLEELLSALRRIATQIMSTAAEGEYPQTGRFTRAAKQLDIEITGLVEGSGGIAAVVSFNENADQTMRLFPDLPSRAAMELLDSIEKESQGRPTNGAVRRYLRALPGELRKQEYRLYDGGRELKRVDIGDLHLTDLPPELPVLHQFEGDIVGVGFEPGRTEVKIKTTTTTAITATTEEVEKALAYRGEKVRTIAVRTGSRTRMISIKRAVDPKFQFDDTAVEEHIFKRWDGLLRRLAR